MNRIKLDKVSKSNKQLPNQAIDYKKYNSSRALIISCVILYLLITGITIFNRWQNNETNKLIASNPGYINANITIKGSKLTHTSYEFRVNKKLYSGTTDVYNEPTVCVIYLKSNPTINKSCGSTQESYLKMRLIGLLIAGFIAAFYFLGKYYFKQKITTK
jgi:hypothetical protein